MAHGEGGRTDDAELRARQANSFGSAADVYEQARPGYPLDAVTDLLPGPPRRALDLGAGTGKLTRALLEAGHEVVAVDPSAGMLDRLRVELPQVEAVQGPAEEIPLPGSSVDAVVAGQAFHWFDTERALPEIARVLRPAGVLGLFWNTRDDTLPWVAAFGRLVGSEDVMNLDPDAPATGPLFTDPERRLYRHTHALDADGLVDLAASRSMVIVRPAEEKAATLAAVRDLAGRHAGPDGLVHMPYQLEVWSATRRG